MQHIQAHSRRRAARLAQALITLTTSVVSASTLAGQLTIEVSGITPGRGRIYVAVYDSAATFPTPGRQLTGQVLDPTDRHLSVHFTDLPQGRYAAVAFQDSNGNGRLDKNLFGIPREPYGFSNGARGTTGAPRFADAAVTVDPDGATRIELK